MNYYPSVFKILGYCLCLDEADVEQVRMDNKLPAHVLPPFDCQGRVEPVQTPSGKLIVMRLQNYQHLTQAEMLGLIVHECEHIKQYIFEDIGEKSPSVEFEAYTIQDIATDMFYEYLTKNATKQAKKPKNKSSLKKGAKAKQ